MRTAALLAAVVGAPLLLAACQHGGTTPSGEAAASLRDSQISACKNEVAAQNAMSADELRSVYDRETPMGTSVVNVMASNGTFACEIGTDLSVKSITRIGDSSGK